MKLIDADKFMKTVLRCKKLNEACPLPKEVESDIDANNYETGQRETFELIIKLLEKQPTAYDVDKVVEQLERIKTDNSCGDCKYKDKCDELQEFYNPSDDVDLCGLTIKHIAIETVKAGGGA